MSTSRAPTYLPLVTACAEHGISRVVAFRLTRAGLLDTFTIGKRRYVFMDSLRSLPDRLEADGKSGADAQPVRLGAGSAARRVSDVKPMLKGTAK